jgi:hypothetical protein
MSGITEVMKKMNDKRAASGEDNSDHNRGW